MNRFKSFAKDNPLTNSVRTVRNTATDNLPSSVTQMGGSLVDGGVSIGGALLKTGASATGKVVHTGMDVTKAARGAIGAPFSMMWDDDAPRRKFKSEEDDVELPVRKGTTTAVVKLSPHDSWKTIGGWIEPDAAANAKVATGVAAVTALVEQNMAESLGQDWAYNTFSMLGCCFMAWLVASWGKSIAWLAVVFLFTYGIYKMEIERFTRNVRDELTRETAFQKLNDSEETLEWLNTFLAKFWVIYMNALTETVISVANEQLADAVPGNGINGLKLDEFTLGNKAPKVEYCQTYPTRRDDYLEMDWKFRFTPDDTSDLTEREVKELIRPKVKLGISLGIGIASKSVPVLVEDMSFVGYMKFKINLMPDLPYVKKVRISFMEEPSIDFGLKPIGGDLFGIDVVKFLPGLSNFINSIIHSNLGPMMYAPNFLEVNVEDLFKANVDDSANAVVAITLKQAHNLKTKSTIGNTLDPYVKLELSDKPDMELDRTEVKSNTSSPKWNETKYLLVNHLTGSDLLLNVFDFNDFRKDKLVGTVRIPLETLQEKPLQENQAGTVILGDEKKVGKEVGTLSYDLRYFPAMEDPDAEESNVGILIFTLHGIRNLDASKSLVGQLNPYADLRINGKAVKTTRTIHHTNDPTYEEKYEMLVSDKQRCKIGLRVYDSRGLSVDPVVGSMNMSLDAALSKLEDDGDWFPLSPIGEARLHLEWKPLALQGLATATAYSDPIGMIRLTIKKAADLKNLETIGTIDPYVRVSVNGAYVGRTATVEETLNPEFNEIIYVPIQYVSQRITLDVMDVERGDDRIVGHRHINVAKLIQEEKDADEHVRYKPYKADKDVTQTVERKGKKTGTITYRMDFFPAEPVYNPTELAQVEKAEAEKAKEEQELADLAAKEGKTLEQKKEELEDAQLASDEEWEYYSDDETKADVNEEVDPSALVSKRKITLPELLECNSGFLVFHVSNVSVPGTSSYLSVVADDRVYPDWVSSKIPNGSRSLDEVGQFFIRELDLSRVTFQLGKKEDGFLPEDVFATVDVPSKTLLEDSYDKPMTLELRGKNDELCKITVQSYLVPVNVELLPEEKVTNSGVLSIFIMKADNVPAADRGNRSDPYANVLLNGKVMGRTDTVKRTLDPVWNYQTEIPVRSRVHDKLRIEVYDWDLGNSDDFLGAVDVSLKDLVPFQRKDYVDVPLEGKSGTITYGLLMKPQYIRPIVKGRGTVTGAGGRVVSNVAGISTRTLSNVGNAGSGVVKTGGSFLKRNLLGRKSKSTHFAEVGEPIDENEFVEAVQSNASTAKQTGSNAPSAVNSPARKNAGIAATPITESAYLETPHQEHHSISIVPSTASRVSNVSVFAGAGGTMTVYPGRGTVVGIKGQSPSSHSMQVRVYIKYADRVKELLKSKNSRSVSSTPTKSNRSIMSGIGDGAAVRWNESFPFRASPDCTIIFRLYESKSFGRHSEIGQGSLTLESVLNKVNEEIDVPIEGTNASLIASFNYRQVV